MGHRNVGIKRTYCPGEMLVCSFSHLPSPTGNTGTLRSRNEISSLRTDGPIRSSLSRPAGDYTLTPAHIITNGKPRGDGVGAGDCTLRLRGKNKTLGPRDVPALSANRPAG